MRALILWAEPESTNLGVRTLARGTMQLLQRAFGDVEFAAQGAGPGAAPVRIGSWRGHAKRLVRPTDELIEWVKTFDLVVDTRGGDSFSDIYGLPRLTTMSLMDEVVRRARVPLVLGPQTIGPFGSRRAKLIARRSLSVAALTFARDEVSAAAAKSLNRRGAVLTTDVVFALDGHSETTPTRDVVVNPSGLLWGANDHVDSSGYRETVTELCRRVLASGRRLTVMAHVLDSSQADNDVPAVRALAHRFDGAVEQVVPADLDEARSVLASAQVVVGSRMHACLNALSVGRPCVPLAYSRKFAPLLAGVGWDHTIDLRDPVDHAALAMHAIERDDLGRSVATVTERADELIEYARQTLVRTF